MDISRQKSIIYSTVNLVGISDCDCNKYKGEERRRRRRRRRRRKR